MTEQEQRIAIAEWNGWKDCFLSPGIGVTGNRPSPMDVYARALIPDFLHDLNAIHEAEGKLSVADQLEYARLLHPPGHEPHLVKDWHILHATAAQRAEALLKTIGKWKD